MSHGSQPWAPPASSISCAIRAPFSRRSARPTGRRASGDSMPPSTRGRSLDRCVWRGKTSGDWKPLSRRALRRPRRPAGAADGARPAVPRARLRCHSARAHRRRQRRARKLLVRCGRGRRRRACAIFPALSSEHQAVLGVYAANAARQWGYELGTPGPIARHAIRLRHWPRYALRESRTRLLAAWR